MEGSAVVKDTKCKNRVFPFYETPGNNCLTIKALLIIHIYIYTNSIHCLVSGECEFPGVV